MDSRLPVPLLAPQLSSSSLFLSRSNVKIDGPAGFGDVEERELREEGGCVAAAAAAFGVPALTLTFVVELGLRGNNMGINMNTSLLFGGWTDLRKMGSPSICIDRMVIC